MDQINVGIIGMGFIGLSHLDAVRRIGNVNLVAISDVNHSQAKEYAQRFGIEKCYENYDELIADPDIRVIHNCTPNHLHLEINKKIIEHGKHVFSEKPLGKTVHETAQMIELLKKYPDAIAGVNFCYRMTPLVQDMKHRIKQGEIGDVLLIHGSYLQDWLLYETDFNWRIEPEFSGPSRCVADIGSHWIDTAQTVMGSRIIEVCADKVTAFPIRKKPVTQVETFSVQDDIKYTDVAVTTEDYAGVLVKFENGVSGIFHCSQISSGRKCFLNLEVNGTDGSYYWNQETSDRMWKGHRNTHSEIVLRNPNLMVPEVRDYTYMPAGHPEGWNDAQKNALFAFYEFIQKNKKHATDKADFATFEEGHHIAKVTEAILLSANERRWVSVDEIS